MPRRHIYHTLISCLDVSKVHDPNPRSVIINPTFEYKKSLCAPRSIQTRILSSELSSSFRPSDRIRTSAARMYILIHLFLPSSKPDWPYIRKAKPPRGRGSRSSFLIFFFCCVLEGCYVRPRGISRDSIRMIRASRASEFVPYCIYLFESYRRQKGIADILNFSLYSSDAGSLQKLGSLNYIVMLFKIHTTLN